MIYINIREQNEVFERLTLIKDATFSSDKVKRKIYEPPDKIRTCFMVDRDRIIHCKSFRRLMHKTQVYINPYGDHYRTRLTHTLEVAQIARTIGAGIGLNQNLIEAISLGHDLGHVAFAHNGEEVLNEFLKEGFRHNEQSVRVVTKLERNGKGLNLTEQVLDGILKHSGLRSNNDVGGAKTLEGKVVQYSDKIAYINHDIDDSIRAGILTQEKLPKEIIKILGNTHSERIETLVTDIVNCSMEEIGNGTINIRLSTVIDDAMRKLRDFMFENVYLSDKLKNERKKAKFILEQLIIHFMNNIDELPEVYNTIAEKEGKERAVADYIAGMSDDFCLSKFNSIYVPKVVIY